MIAVATSVASQSVVMPGPIPKAAQRRMRKALRQMGYKDRQINRLLVFLANIANQLKHTSPFYIHAEAEKLLHKLLHKVFPPQSRPSADSLHETLNTLFLPAGYSFWHDADQPHTLRVIQL